VTAPSSPTAPPEPTAAATSTAIRSTDGLGNTVTLAAPARRVVSLAPSNTELLFAVGAGDQVVARDDFSDYPSESKSLPTIGGSNNTYNLEAITALKPDLVLAAELNTPDQVKALTNLGLTVYYLANPKDFEGLYRNLTTVGLLTGHQTEAQTLVTGLRARVAAVSAAVQNAPGRPKVFYELDGSDPTKPWTAGKGSFVDLLITAAGGQNVGQALATSYGQLSQEELLLQNPQIILLGDSAYGVTPDQVRARTGWANLAAVSTGQIFTFDDNLASRPGPRLVDGLEAMARLFHPQLLTPTP
jgi:iron complex transport system substrate-binding protein